jgi:hypothetical protein
LEVLEEYSEKEVENVSQQLQHVKKGDKSLKQSFLREMSFVIVSQMNKLLVRFASKIPSHIFHGNESAVTTNLSTLAQFDTAAKVNHVTLLLSVEDFTAKV